MNYKIILLFLAFNVLYVVKTMPVPFNGFKYPGITSTFSNFFVNDKNNFFDNFFTSGGWGGNNWAKNNDAPNWFDNNWENKNKKDDKKKDDKKKDKNNNNWWGNNQNNNNGWNWGNDWWSLGDANKDNKSNENKDKDSNSNLAPGQSVGHTASTTEFDTSKITVELYDEDADVPVIN